MLTVLKAPGLATVQDLGWRIGRAIGLPQSGAVDPAALQTANALVGNPPGAAAIELALADFSVRFGTTRRFATAGAVGEVTLGGIAVDPRTTAVARAGEILAIEPARTGRFGYLAVEGGIAVALTLGSRSTYLPTALGGFQGRRLGAGDEVPLGAAAEAAPPAGFRAPAGRPIEGPIRVLAGPQAHLFTAESMTRLETAGYTVAPASDRMGTRLTGPPLVPTVTASLPSEGACLGALQVPDNGQPIALLVDGPTVGGYPKVAVIASADFSRFAQLGPGAVVRFQLISVAEAQEARSVAIEQVDRVLTAIREAWCSGT